eukprot:TRINITY_DN65648_c0_g1_i1.p1 TRINITY_DN65648_c0_g1~~TRINITY_DN65648_c0_g1_i1.p1  ORF type:complete len:356 (-),score=27.57 TRINITY_DN65648_c0_g1_i1:220-1287(-)
MALYKRRRGRGVCVLLGSAVLLSDWHHRRDNYLGEQASFAAPSGCWQGRPVLTGLTYETAGRNHDRGARATGRALPGVAMAGPVGTSAGVLGAFNALGFLISLATGSHLHLDLIGTGAFVFAALLSRGTGLASRVSTAAVVLWGTRLAAFLFYRALQVQHDARLEVLLETASGAFTFWLISFVWGFVCLLPHALGAAPTVAQQPSKIGAIGLTGLLLFAWGLGWEVVADWQKYWFAQDPANQGHFCNVGLWALSQHPNYFGNLCLWTGIVLLNLPAIASFQPIAGSSTKGLIVRCTRIAAGFLCPLFLALLFSGQASGSVGTARDLAMKKYGGDPSFLSYIRDVPLIFPRFPGVR